MLVARAHLLVDETDLVIATQTATAMTGPTATEATTTVSATTGDATTATMAIDAATSAAAPTRVTAA